MEFSLKILQLSIFNSGYFECKKWKNIFKYDAVLNLFNTSLTLKITPNVFMSLIYVLDRYNHLDNQMQQPNFIFICIYNSDILIFRFELCLWGNLKDGNSFKRTKFPG